MPDELQALASREPGQFAILIGMHPNAAGIAMPS